VSSLTGLWLGCGGGGGGCCSGRWKERKKRLAESAMLAARSTAQAHAASILSSLFPCDDSPLPFSLQQHWREESRMDGCFKEEAREQPYLSEFKVFYSSLLFIYPNLLPFMMLSWRVRRRKLCTNAISR